jgi:CHAD domain-containing protein
MRERERRVRRAIKSLERLDIEQALQQASLALTDHAPRFFAVRRRVSAAESWEDLLDTRLRERAGELKAAVARAGGVIFSNRLHGARIAAKKLRYAMEIATETGHADFRPQLQVLKKSQELLGSLHDHDVLNGALRTEGAGAQRLLPMIDMRRRRLHERYLRRRDALLEVCEAAARGASRDQRSMLARRVAMAGALPLAVLALPLVRRRLA